MADIGDYTFLTTNLLTGNVIDVVEMSSFYWDEVYNSPGAGLGTARLDVASTTTANFQDWRNGFWAVKDGEIQWGGIIGDTQVRGGTHVLNVPVHGFMTYYNSRFIRNAAGMTYGNLVRTSDIEWRDVDQFNIVKDIIDHVHSFADGDIGIGVEWDTLSGVELTIINRTFTIKRAAVAIQELSARLQGFSYRQVYAWDGNKPTCSFKLQYPTHSHVIDDNLLYQPERISVQTVNLLNALRLDGVANTFASTDGTATGNFTDNLTLVGCADNDDWTPSAAQTFVSKWGSAGNRSYRFYINSTGRLVFSYTEDGSTIVNMQTAATGLTSGIRTFKVEFNATSGDADFSISTDYGASYTPFETVSGSGSVTIFDGTADIQVGAYDSGNRFEGDILFAAGYDETDTLDFVFDARALDIDITQYIDPVDNVWNWGGNAEIVSYSSTTKEVRSPIAKRSNILTYDDEGVKSFATGLAVIGGGEGDNQKLIYISNTHGGAPLWEDKLTFTDEFDESILLQRGKLSLDACSSAGDRNLTLEMDRELPPFQDDIFTGDSARVVINDQMHQEDDLYWVGRKRITLGDNQDNDITLEVTKRTLVRLIYGYGSSVEAGLNQPVYLVDTTADSGSGSLRDALSTGNRYIQMDPSLAGSTIDLGTDIDCDSLPNITLNGVGRVTITGASLNFTNCDELELVDLTFLESDGSSVVINSKTGLGEVDIHFRITGCSFIGPCGATPLKIIENYGHAFYGTIAYCKFDKNSETVLVDDGTNNGGNYFITWHNNWFNDNEYGQPIVDYGRFHMFNCLFERYGGAAGGGEGAVAKDDAQLFIEYSYVIPRIISDTVGFYGTAVTAARAEFSAPVFGETNAIVALQNNTLTGIATGSGQDASSIFTPPYVYYKDPAPNAELIRWEAGAKLNGPQSTDYTVWNYPTPTTPPSSGPLAIDVVSSPSRNTGGPQTVANPNQGSSNTIIFLCVAPGPGESASGSFTAPHASATQIFNYDPGGSSFVPRVRMWSLTENGDASFTYGWSDAADTQVCLAWIYDGVASSLNVGTENVSGSDTLAFNALSGVAVDDHITAIAINQGLEAITAKSSPVDTEAYDDTGVKFGVALYTGVITSGTSVTPGSVTWESEGQASIQIVIGATGVGTGGGTGNVRLDDSVWTVFVDPNNPATYGPARANGQLICCGNRLNAGATSDNINYGSGYGLSFDGNTEIHSFTMEDGDTLRFGARTVTGLFNTTRALVGKSQYRKADGYVAEQEGGYSAAPPGTPLGVNMSTTWPGTDRLYFDGGPRIQIAQIPTSGTDPKAIKASYDTGGGTEFILCGITRIESWMRAEDNTSFNPIEIHGPVPGNGYGGGPIACFTNSDGEFEIVTRDLSSAWNNTTNPTNVIQYSRSFSAGDVGDWWGFIAHGVLDPVQGWLDFYLNTGSGFSQVVNVTGGWGWAWAEGTSYNDLFYTMLGPRIYNFHRYVDVGKPSQNYDDTYGNVRTIIDGWSSCIMGATSVTVSQVQGHLNYFLAG